MAASTVTLTLDDFEQRLMVNGLVEFKNGLQVKDKPTEDVDDLILKVIDAPQTKQRKKESREER
ncbi:MAG: hypothetical protein IKE18_08335 [Oscillospiraceae bacterium]|nr:hypothetical protein [Oscillospiraceae bacterium]